MRILIVIAVVIALCLFPSVKRGVVLWYRFIKWMLKGDEDEGDDDV